MMKDSKIYMLKLYEPGNEPNIVKDALRAYASTLRNTDSCSKILNIERDLLIQTVEEIMGRIK